MPHSRATVRVGLLWLAIGVFYIVTAPGNRSEADDAFAFAHDVEDVPLTALVAAAHTPHVAFLPFWRLLHRSAIAAGFDWRAYDVIRVADSFAAAAAVLVLFALLRGRFGTSGFAAGASAACLAVSYGFWRYANEGDAYPLAILAVLVSCWFSLDERATPRLAAIAGAAAAAATLIHILGFIPAVTVAPVSYLALKRLRSLAVYAATFTTLFLGVTFFTFRIAGAEGMSYREYLVGDAIASYSYDAPLKALVGLIPDLASANIMFASPRVTAWLQDRVPTLDLRQEAFAAAHAPEALLPLAAILILGVAILAVLLVARSLRGPPKVDAKLASIIAWVVLFCIVVMGRSPAAQESWVPLLAPIWILIGVLVFDRASGASARGLVVCFVALFALENAVAGMAVVRSERWDLNALRASWLVTHAESDDTIFSGDGPIFDWYLAYQTTADVVSLRSKTEDEIAADLVEAAAGSGSIYFLDTVFVPPPEYRALDPGGYEETVRFGASVRPYCEVAHRSELIVVYVCSAVSRDVLAAQVTASGPTPLPRDPADTAGIVR